MPIYIFKLRQNYRTGSTNLIKGPTFVTFQRSSMGNCLRSIAPSSYV